MSAITQGTRIVEDISVKTQIIKINNANIVEIEVGTNGFRGGDRGHGSRTYFRFKDVAATDMKITVLSDDEFELEFCGDAELETFIEALEFTMKTLRLAQK